MKKYLLMAALALACGSAEAQYTVPNGDFENWNSVAFDQLQYYRTSATETFYTCNSVASCVKTADAHHGSWAVKLTSLSPGNNGCFGYLVNGNPENDPPWHGGIAYNQKPAGIQGYYKSAIPQGDSALIVANFSREGVNIGFYVLKLYGTHNTYTPFSMTFSPALQQTPDSVIFAATSSNVLGGSIIAGSMLQLDHVLFTGVETQPALMNGDFESWTPQSINKPGEWYVERNENTGVDRTNDKHSGNYAIILTTTAGTMEGVPVARPGFVSTGYYRCDDNNNCMHIGGSPFGNQVDTLCFWYKYLPQNEDMAEVDLQFKKSGSPINWAGKQLEASEAYRYTEIPFSNWDVPDTVIIQAFSSAWDHLDMQYSGSVLTLDDMYFKSNKAPVGVRGLLPSEKIAVYPNPGNGIFSLKSALRISSVEVMNLLGETVFTSPYDNSQVRINLADQPNGIYFYQVKRGDQVVKKGKLVIRH